MCLLSWCKLQYVFNAHRNNVHYFIYPSFCSLYTIIATIITPSTRILVLIGLHALSSKKQHESVWACPRVQLILLRNRIYKWNQNLYFVIIWKRLSFIHDYYKKILPYNLWQRGSHLHCKTWKSNQAMRSPKFLITRANKCTPVQLKKRLVV